MSAIEIFTNRNDLHCHVGEFTNFPGEYGFMISRSIGHNYKPLLSSKPGPKWTREQAIEALKEILTGVVKESTKLMLSETDATASFFRSLTGLQTEKGGPLSEQELEKAEITLTLKDVDNISVEVKEKGFCDTKEWGDKNS